MPPWVRVHALGARRIRTAALRLLGLVRRLRPHVILSGAPHLNFLVLLLRPLFPRGTRVLVRQSHTASARFASGHWPDHSRWLYRFLYPRADRVICQTRAMAADLAAHAGLQLTRVHVLPNPVDIECFPSLERTIPEPWQGPGPHLLAVGRLSHEKGFDLLLHAFASVRAHYSQAQLCILGTGLEESTLRATARRLDMTASVRFAGYVARPELWFEGATLFVLPSRTEGLPNALLEAAAAGLPLAATPCSDGVVNLLAGESGAWLATDLSAGALSACILSALEALEHGKRFDHAWVDEFRMGRAVARYEELIDRLPASPVT